MTSREVESLNTLRVAIPTQLFPPIIRRAIRFRIGERGLATREECRSHFEDNGTSIDEDIVAELLAQEPQWGVAS